MSDQDVFDKKEVQAPSNGEENPLPNNETVPGPSPHEDLLKEIKDENGRQKYNSVQDALNALTHSQNHIRTLEEERKKERDRIAELEEVASRVATVEDTVKNLLTRNQDPDRQTTEAVFDENKVADLVRKTIEADHMVATRTANRQKVSTMLAEKFGDKASEMVVKKAQSLGTTPERLGNLAEESPELVFSLFNGERGPTPGGPTTPDVNIPSKPVNQDGPPKPEKSLLAGATSAEQAEFMRKIKANVYKRLGVEE